MKSFWLSFIFVFCCILCVRSCFCDQKKCSGELRPSFDVMANECHCVKFAE